MNPTTIDLHCHLAPGADHGSRSPVESLALARGLARSGFRRVHMTPHQYRFGNAFTLDHLTRMAQGVQQLLDDAGVELEVVPSAEHYFGRRLLEALRAGEELASFTFRDQRCVLIELPLREPVVGVRRLAEALTGRGLRPVMAHPERIDPSLAGMRRRQQWLDAGWVFQLDLLSLAGHYGHGPKAAAETLVAEGQVFGIGSDLHRPSELDALAPSLARLEQLTTRQVPIS